ncbi:hypothetical protein HK103_000411 [Boothiomyces macroporosus]|uniref:Enoyl reductase (ER) domain-containing protein n=1 Tax=Boothiomyces macroporosus TaxID=261099 RepID=A0AAD5UF77_9FUNG|nr:hypothetical protein HK103_000411 [Boothiomyces macroporosus]
MKAVIVEQPGSASFLKLGQVPDVVPKADELLVKVKYFGLNRMDILQRDGRYPVPPNVSPILGVEFSGDVVTVPSNSKFKVGDRVFGLVYGGAYAEYVAINEKMAMHIPQSLSYKEAAALPEVYFTALQALIYIGKVKENENVLIHAGASGVGTAAIQIANANIIVTAGSDEKIAYCKSLGATSGINYKTTPEFGQQVLKETGRGADFVLDFIGASYWKNNMEALAMDGRMVILGLMGGFKLPEVDISPFLRKRIQVSGSTLRSRTVEYQAQLKEIFEKELLPRIVSGELKPVIDREYSWNNIVDAHLHMEANGNIGKILVSTDE